MGLFCDKGGWSLERWVLTIPALGLLTVALALSLGGTSRPIVSAQVYGGPTDASGPWSGRIFVVRELDEEIVPWAGAPVEVVRSGGGVEDRVQGETGPEGWLDVTLPARANPSGFSIRVMSLLDGSVLAEGSPEFPVERWATAPRRGLSPAQERRARLRLPSGVLSVPFRSRLELEPLRCLGAGAEWARLSGAKFLWEGRPLERLELTDPGPREVQIEPREHVVSLDRGCLGEPDAPRVSLTLPVVPGALHFEKRGEDLAILAPIQVPAIWYTFVTESARLAGGRLQLVAEADGTSAGLLPARLVPKEPDLYLVLSTSPDGRSPSTVGYPLVSQRRTFDAVDGHLIDGGPDAHQRETERRRRMVRALFGYVAALFALSLWLFRLVIRRSDDKLLADLRRGEAPAGLLSRPRARPSVVAGLTIALGLSLVLLWIAVFGGTG